MYMYIKGNGYIVLFRLSLSVACSITHSALKALSKTDSLEKGDRTEWGCRQGCRACSGGLSTLYYIYKTDALIPHEE